MEINKQLFEDVLSGKLKGTFVLRNGKRFNSKHCHRNINTYSASHPYCLCCNNYYFSCKSNGMYLYTEESGRDIVDFIPDIDKIEIDPERYSYNEKDIQFIEHFIKGHHMKENELTIEIPDNKVVDWDESKKQNKIVLKNKRLTYNDIIKHAETGSISNIHYFSDDQMECLLAKNRLANVAKYLNGEWKPDARHNIAMITVDISNNIVVVSVMNGSIASNCGSIWFKTEELARQAIEILGEETIKLALEPLGI